jgi:UDP-glucose 4-epimerase
VERLGGEVVNIACAERTSLNQIIARINELIGANVKAEYQPPRAGDVRHSLADISEAARVIGSRPKIMFDEGLKRSIEWFKANPA